MNYENIKRKREILLSDGDLIYPKQFKDQFNALIQYTRSSIENNDFQEKCKKILRYTDPNKKENDRHSNREQYQKMRKHFLQKIVDFEQNKNQLLRLVRQKVKGTKMDLLFHMLDENLIVKTKKFNKKCKSTLTGKLSQEPIMYEMAFNNNKE